MPQPDYRAIAHIAGEQLMQLRYQTAMTLRFYRAKRAMAGDRVVMWSTELDDARHNEETQQIALAGQRVEEWMMLAKQWAQAIEILRTGLKATRKR